MAFEQYTEIKNYHFSIADYVVFTLMILGSTGCGIYFGWYKPYKKRKQGIISVHSIHSRQTDFGSKKLNDYLLGSRKLKIFPVAMSLLASYISGVTILGTPSEIYNYGTQYWLICVSIVFMGVAVSLLYLPVFARLRVGSSYEYLEFRFSSIVRSIASFMFVMDEIFFLPIIVYVPAIALSQVTGIYVHYISLAGGIKAVVHTDAWQIMVMFIATCVIAILGTCFADEPSKIMEHAVEGGRIIFFNVNPSFYERQTMWGVLIGGFMYWTSFNSVNQTMVQRYMSLPTLRKGQYSIMVFTAGIVGFVSICCYTGLLIYDKFRNCDPKTMGFIHDDDQLLPLYVMQTVGHLQGIPGLFIAGVFGAALSSLSVVLNSTALVLHEDIVKGCFKMTLTPRASSILIKSSIVVLGVIAFALVYVVERLSGILSVATALTAIAAGTTFGLFTLGILVPWSNNIGALVGGFCGAIMSAWISFGTQAAMASGAVVPKKLPLSIDGCATGNTTMAPPEDGDESNVFPLHRLSFHWINPIGVLTTVLVGFLVSVATGRTRLKSIDPDLISPVLHRFLPKECFKQQPANNEAEIEITRENTAQTLTQLLADGDQPKIADRKKY